MWIEFEGRLVWVLKLLPASINNAGAERRQEQTTPQMLDVITQNFLRSAPSGWFDTGREKFEISNYR